MIIDTSNENIVIINTELMRIAFEKSILNNDLDKGLYEIANQSEAKYISYKIKSNGIVIGEALVKEKNTSKALELIRDKISIEYSQFKKLKP